MAHSFTFMTPAEVSEVFQRVAPGSRWKMCEACCSIFSPERGGGLYGVDGNRVEPTPCAMAPAQVMARPVLEPSTARDSAAPVGDPCEEWSFNDWLTLIASLKPLSPEMVELDMRYAVAETRLTSLIRGPAPSFSSWMYDSSTETQAFFYFSMGVLIEEARESSREYQATTLSPILGEVRRVRAAESVFNGLANNFIQEGARELLAIFKAIGEARSKDTFQCYYIENGVTKARPWLQHFTENVLKPTAIRLHRHGTLTPPHLAICERHVVSVDAPWKIDVLKMRFGILNMARRFGSAADANATLDRYRGHIAEVLEAWYQKHIASGSNATSRTDYLKCEKEATSAPHRPRTTGREPQQAPKQPAKRIRSASEMRSCRQCKNPLPSDHRADRPFCQKCYDPRRKQGS